MPETKPTTDPLRQATERGYMRQALALARRAWGRTSPNPLVGALVVRGGEVVGQGYHQRAGTAHAEVHAVDAAGARAQGATLYVTLEPCSTFGRTPPCTEAILNAGIGRVVVGCLDPNPRHAGAGVEVLRQAGIDVEVGVMKAACSRLNEAFFWWISTGRPFVLLKLAMTLDGRIATRGGQSKWITGAAARRQVQRLRQWADAIMVGGETVRRDDPELTVRMPKNWAPQPRPLVWSSKPIGADARLRRAQRPEALRVKPVSQAEWLALLEQLGKEEVTALLLEGGGELAAAALQAGIVNRIDLFVAPKILGGRLSRPVVGGADPESLDQALPLLEMTTRRIGDDLLIRGYCSNVYRTH